MTEPISRLQKYSAPALEKGLDILELLSLRPGVALTHADIAKGIGRSKNEIFRMMVVLEERGYICRGEGDVFFLTPKLGELGGVRNPTGQMIDIARPLMAQLSQKIEQSNHLWVIEDSKMRVGAAASAAGSYSLALSEGVQAPVFGSSAGACFLAGLPDADARLQKLATMDEFVAAGAYAPFDKDVEDCARTDVCVLSHAENAGIVEISAPLWTKGRTKVVGALSVPMIRSGDRPNEIGAVVAALKETIEAIRAKLVLLAVFEEVI
ncbi:IclR family transcriptional regulator [Shimia sp. MMG029]|uniref:IclR family transcriptional regulator n=1 Tax=Shimia sp. MMG029 TaxID=3021978 RepID=UPI0022FF06B8|nr:helix-turn-helix domain-containing protein [Shimia sp. MMG029]MDA5558393.1 helix-turn-helix domain-containing protein [Shimia sp. MMG029]